MKIQCPCGAKFAIDVAPGMQPVQFVCPNCGGDYSAFVNELIQRELAENFPSSTAPQPASPSAPVSSSPGLRISRAQAPSAPVAAPETPEAKVCAKHNEPAAEQCAICHKPICPKCMDIFGFFCSAYCKSKAEVGKMKVAAYAGGTFANEARFWRKLGLISGVVGTLAALGLGVWIWYTWIASMPHQYFSATFDQVSHTGSSYLNGSQIVFLHGGTLARYDMKAGKQIWSKELVSQDQIDEIVKSVNDAQAVAHENNSDMDVSSVPSSLREKYTRIGLEGELSLHCAGQNIWVANGGQLTQYDWNSGNVLQTVAMPDSGESTARGNELLTFGSGADGAPAVVQVDLTSGALTTNVFHDPAVAGLAENSSPAGAAGTSTGGGLPLSPYQSAQPMDSQRVAQQAQNLSLQGQIALPAVIANNSYEQRLEGAMNDGQDKTPHQHAHARPANTARQPEQSDQSAPLDFTLIPDNDGYEEFSCEMVQENLVQHEAMKAPPSNSALASVSGGNESAAINEQLNDMQRQNGADKVTEDQSTYRITVRQAGSPQNSWTGEVIGPPQLIPLKTVNVLAAGKTVIVFDKSNKKLWQTTLTYDITGGDKQRPHEQSPYGDGPCVEHDGALYVFDQAVLSAFDLATGNARWHLPTVGVVGLFFDEKGMLYVNTTTGNPDDIKYSRQIDVTKATAAVILKIDPVAGKILWKSQGSGYVSYVSGKFIYAVQSFDPGDQDDQMTDNTLAMFKPALTRIIRISPSNGHALWQIDQDRAPMNVQFDGNYIHIIFKKEVQVLHFLAL